MGRKDGRKIKGVDAFTRIGSLMVGETRNEAQNFYTHEVLTKQFDEYIEKKKAEGKYYTYRDLAIAALVRVFYLRPHLNRFVMRGNFYQRNFIDISLVMHKNLRTGEKETIVKCRYTGKETLDEIKAKIDETIMAAMKTTNDADDFIDKVGGKMPTWLLRIMMKCMRLFDRWGWLSDDFMFHVSPFHCSILFADLKSIHLSTVWHHMYNFGNCGFMCTMGKEKYRATVDPKTLQVKSEKVLELGITQDERFIDGLMYSHMIKHSERILQNLEVLERAPEDDEIRLPIKTSYEKKVAAKLAKRAAKKARKEEKKKKK